MAKLQWSIKAFAGDKAIGLPDPSESTEAQFLEISAQKPNLKDHNITFGTGNDGLEIAESVCIPGLFPTKAKPLKKDLKQGMAAAKQEEAAKERDKKNRGSASLPIK